MKDTKIAIEGDPNLYTNAHGELKYAFGQGRIGKDIAVDADDGVSVRLHGRCKRCGNITITAGTVAPGQESQALRPRPARRGAPGRPELPGPSTYHTPLFRVYGQKRFGHMEGLHGVLHRPPGLIKSKPY